MSDEIPEAAQEIGIEGVRVLLVNEIKTTLNLRERMLDAEMHMQKLEESVALLNKSQRFLTVAMLVVMATDVASLALTLGWRLWHT